MTYYHITHKNRVASILENGLLIKYAKNKRQRFVWVNTEISEKLLIKTAKRHKWQPRNMVIFQIDILSDIFIKHPNKISKKGYVLKTGRDIEAKYLTLLEAK